MTAMTISQARASLAEVVDQVRLAREPVYLTRRNRPVVALVDIDSLNALLRLQTDETSVTAASQDEERERRLADMAAGAKAFDDWFDSGVPYPDSASDLYATRRAEP